MSTRFVQAPKTFRLSQFSPVLVGNYIIGIVRPGSIETEPAQNLAGQQAAGEDPVAAVGFASSAIQDRLKVLQLQGPFLSRGRSKRGFRVDLQLLRSQLAQIVFRLKVTQGPENPVGDHRRSGGAFGVAFWIECQKPGFARAITNRKTGSIAFRLGLRHLPRSRRRSFPGCCAASCLRDLTGPRMRLVNQLESGTSSMVLMFCARRPPALPGGRIGSVSGRTSDRSSSSTFEASCVSGSTAMGSSL